jgi:hypothetical protein
VGPFTPRPLNRRERAPGTHWTEGWVGPRAGLDTMKNKISCPCWESNPDSSVVRLSLPPASAGLLRGLLIKPEDGGGMFIRNVGLSLN